MHEQRNLALTLALILAAGWGFYVWLVAPSIPLPIPAPGPLFHRVLTVVLVFGLGAVLVYAYRFEEKLPDELGPRTLGRFFERDGLCFMPMLRVADAGADARPRVEIALFFQSRYSGECEAVIHLRPEPSAIHSHPGARDIHFAFCARAGAFGVIHQPIAVDHDALGTPVRLQVAAAVRWIRGKGEQVRSRRGEPCGTFPVDWALAYRQSEHELGGEIELENPASITLTIPDRAAETTGRPEYTIEVISTLASPARAHTHA